MISALSNRGLPQVSRRIVPSSRVCSQAYNALLLRRVGDRLGDAWKRRQLEPSPLRRQIAKARVMVCLKRILGYLNLLNSVEIIVDTEEPESISLDIQILYFVHSSDLNILINIPTAWIRAYHGEWWSTDFSNVIVRTDESLGQVSRGVSLDQDQNSTYGSQEKLDVSETGADKTRNTDSEVAVDYDNQVRNHVNERPGHTFNGLLLWESRGML